MTKYVHAQSLAVPVEFASGNWGGLSVVEDQVFFGLCSHRIDENVTLCIYKDSNQSIVALPQFQELLSSDAGAVAHGKIHTPFRVIGRRAYFGTHLGYYRKDLQGRNSYVGGRLMSIDLDDLHIEDLGVLQPGEGIISLEVDAEREHVYVFTWPRTDLIRYDCRSGELRNLGNFRRSLSADTCCRAPVFVDDHLVFCTGDGAVHSWNAKHEQFQTFDQSLQELALEVAVRDDWKLPKGIDAATPTALSAAAAAMAAEPGWGRLYHPAIPDADGRSALVLTNTSSSLLRVSPRDRRISHMAQVCTAANSGRFDIGTSTSLTLTRNVDGWLYHIGTELLGDAANPKIRARVIRFDPATSEVQDMGRIRTDDGQDVIYLQTLDHLSDGRLVAVGLVDLPEAKRAAFFASSPAKVDVGIRAETNPYEMRFLIMDPVRSVG